MGIHNSGLAFLVQKWIAITVKLRYPHFDLIHPIENVLGSHAHVIL